MKVKCINDGEFEGFLSIKGCLTKNKIYEVLDEENRVFFIKNDKGVRLGYVKERFEVVKENVVEKTEFTFNEVIARIKPGEEYECTEDDYRIKSIVKDDDGIRFIYSPSTILPDSLRIPDYVEFKLKKKEPEYMTFLEAKEKGVPKHKDCGYNLSGTLVGMREFLKEMDRKEWTIEGEC